MEATIKCYRVWMKDGYAGLHSAATADEAAALAVEFTRKNIEGAVMTPQERRKALAVDKVECLDRD